MTERRKLCNNCGARKTRLRCWRCGQPGVSDPALAPNACECGAFHCAHCNPVCDLEAAKRKCACSETLPATPDEACIPCDLHGFCHLCETEEQQGEIGRLKAENKSLLDDYMRSGILLNMADFYLYRQRDQIKEVLRLLVLNDLEKAMELLYLMVEAIDEFYKVGYGQA